MISNELVQAALVAKINNTPLVMALVSGTVLEYNFQGTDWIYPCARLQLEPQIGAGNAVACPSFIEFSFYGFSEQGTSKEANQIAGAFVTSFRSLSFSQNNIKFSNIEVLENIPAIRQDVRTWRSQVRCRVLLHRT